MANLTVKSRCQVADHNHARPNGGHPDRWPSDLPISTTPTELKSLTSNLRDQRGNTI